MTDPSMTPTPPHFDDDYLVLHSGRRLYVNRGIIGLDPDLRLSHGYDGGFNYTWPPSTWGDSTNTLSPAEVHEIADVMIARWVAFKATLPVIP